MKISHFQETNAYVLLDDYSELEDKAKKLEHEAIVRQSVIRNLNNQVVLLTEVIDKLETQIRAHHTLISARTYINRLIKINAIDEKDGLGAWRILGNAASDLVASSYDSVAIYNKYEKYNEITHEDYQD